MDERPLGIWDDQNLMSEYLTWLEGQNRRLRNIEGVLNKISVSTMNNRDNFMREFKPFLEG